MSYATMRKQLANDAMVLDVIIARYTAMDLDPRYPAESYNASQGDRLRELRQMLKGTAEDLKATTEKDPITRLKMRRAFNTVHSYALSAFEAEGVGKVMCMYFPGVKRQPGIPHPYNAEIRPFSLNDSKIKAFYIGVDHAGDISDIDYLEKCIAVYSVYADVGAKDDYLVYRTLDKEDAENYLKKLDQEVNTK